jgi:hypothetical protein
MRRSQQEQNIFTKVASPRWEVVSAPRERVATSSCCQDHCPAPGTHPVSVSQLVALPGTQTTCGVARVRPARTSAQVPHRGAGHVGDAACPSGQLGVPPNPVRGCPCGGPRGSPRPRTHSGQRRHRGTDPAAFMQVNSYIAWHGGVVCKPSAQPTLVRTQHLPHISAGQSR